MAFIGAPSPAESKILTTIEPNRRQYLGDGEQTVFAVDYYENFVLVFQNGIKLTENLDYEIGQDSKHIRFIVAPEMNDTIDLYGTIDIANTENRTIYSNTSFTTFTSLTDVDTLSATDNQVLTTDANGYFYFRDTTLNELTDVNSTANIDQVLVAGANNHFHFRDTTFSKLTDVNLSMSSAQYLTGDANGYFFANTEFKNLVDVNSTANNGQILVADGSGNFFFEDKVTSLADFDMTSMANNSIDANKLVDGSLTNTNFTANSISGENISDTSITENKISGTISGVKLTDASVPLSKLSETFLSNISSIEFKDGANSPVGIKADNDTMILNASDTNRIIMDQSGNFYPAVNGEPSLGLVDNKWNNLHVNHIYPSYERFNDSSGNIYANGSWYTILGGLNGHQIFDISVSVAYSGLHTTGVIRVSVTYAEGIIFKQTSGAGWSGDVEARITGTTYDYNIELRHTTSQSNDKYIYWRAKRIGT